MQAIWRDRYILLPIVLFYLASCGSERLFQTMEFTFGLCEPLKLSSKEAVLTDDMYNGGFFIGRLASIFVVSLVSPKTMIRVSLILCTLSTLLLSIEAEKSSTLLFVSASIYGFAISWQYASAYSWTAENIDVVGYKASIFTIGCANSFVAPMAGAYIFKRISPMSMWHFNSVLVLIQILAFYLMDRQFKKCQVDERGKDYGYKELSQRDDGNLITSDRE